MKKIPSLLVLFLVTGLLLYLGFSGCKKKAKEAETDKFEEPEKRTNAAENKEQEDDSSDDGEW